MRLGIICVWLGLVSVVFTGCKEAIEPVPAETLTLVSSIPGDGDSDISVGKNEIVLSFSENIKLHRPVGVQINGEETDEISPDFNELKIRMVLESGQEYHLFIPAGKIEGRETGAFAPEINIRFTTQEVAPPVLVTPDPMPQTQKVFDFLQDAFGSFLITGTMANVAWNNHEAEWVYQHTSRYPALNGYDYIHLHASPSSWIDYGNIDPVVEWWEQNGLVSMMWHWNVPVEKGSEEYAFYTAETSFDVSKAVQPGTSEYEIVLADFEKIGDYLSLLKKKNIPVIWRPLHEGAGKWFWWGAKGAESYKKLWKLMFEKFQDRGLDHLIWVWTSQIGDDDWYPGDEYVDIIGRDAYNIEDVDKLETEYQWLKDHFPAKLVALSEFGQLPDMASQWKKGLHWVWMMPWYDYERTLNPSGSAFQERSHRFADISYWERVWEDKKFISRDQMPDLK